MQFIQKEAHQQIPKEEHSIYPILNILATNCNSKCKCV